MGPSNFIKNAKRKALNPDRDGSLYHVKNHTIKEGKGKTILLLLAQNYTGYKNLMKLSTIAQVERVYYKPRFTRELLKNMGRFNVTLPAPRRNCSELLRRIMKVPKRLRLGSPKCLVSAILEVNVIIIKIILKISPISHVY